MIGKQLLILLFLLTPILFSSYCYGQISGLLYEDEVYNDNIKSVKFHLTGFPLTQPIIDLNSNATLTLSFDDLGAEVRNLYYTLIHCNADWEPSDLGILEYITGFDEDEIRSFDFSFNTLTEFTNYQLQLPNNNMGWTKSGNYILVVFENESDKTPLVSRRFMVVEPLTNIIPAMVRPANHQKSNTHQEIDFKVTYDRLDVRDPKKELKATILQNSRWDNAIINKEPYFIYQNEVVFDYQNEIVFPAGKEFRFIDLRSFRFKSEGVISIEEYKDIYEITLYPEPVRAFTAYQFFRDINGNFTIENIHEVDGQLRSDYGLVLFSLEKNLPFEEYDVYLVGEMTDWKMKEAFKMAYSEKLGLYAVDVLLKQGFYNYAYAVVPFGEDLPINLSEIEGDWFETENEYTVLVYYRSFGGRYDRLVGAVTFKSNE